MRVCAGALFEGVLLDLLILSGAHLYPRKENCYDPNSLPEIPLSGYKSLGFPALTGTERSQHQRTRFDGIEPS